jgi:carbamate kinase
MTTETSKLIVVALGGNAITEPDQQGDVAEQFANSRGAAKPLADLVEQGHRLIVTHGNGPQIGNFLLRNDAGAGVIYPLPMVVAVAHVQGGMGYMIAQTLTNELRKRGRDGVVTSVITTVLVSPTDPALTNPTKPIGRTVSKVEADEMAGKNNWIMKEITPGSYRRVVASPMPTRIMEIDHIRRAVEAGETLVVCGGGGIPVMLDENDDLQGLRAVVDKDLASALLALDVGADAMMILTNIDRVRINFGKPDERVIERMTLSEAKVWYEEGQFPPGSMGPKILGAIKFLSSCKNKNATVVIGQLDAAVEAMAGKTGTCITVG